jgi:uncharacterized SAM-binding protein YcdF (DUF218 family)
MAPLLFAKTLNAVWRRREGRVDLRGEMARLVYSLSPKSERSKANMLRRKDGVHLEARENVSGRAPLSQTSSKFWGTFVRKERWGLSWRGWLIIFLAVLLIFYVFSFRIYPFLAVTHRTDTNTLIVEGWIHEYAIRAAIKEFRSNHYQRVFTTGGPVAGTGGYINDYNTSASVGAEMLTKNGLPNESLQMVPSRVMDRDRTYGSAVALRNWFREHNMSVLRINVVTEDLHARRTQLLFEKALGNNVAVGIIAVPNPDYDARRWWRYSEGVKDVVNETVAYLYTELLFYPSDSKHDLRQ